MSEDTRHATLDLPLLSLPTAALLLAQFLSALADNAVLIAAIAIVKAAGQAGRVPLLQEAFVVPFILLAPFVGQVADAFPKGRVMLVANCLKLSGACAMAFGLEPFVAYGLIGIGAAAYSPAKYGILAQMFSAERLVKANGMLEGSTIVAILAGVLLGGWLADHSLFWAFTGVIVCYGLAAGANLLIPRLLPESPEGVGPLLPLVSKFGRTLGGLLADKDARFSLFGTSVFWGSGTTLRLMLFAWVPLALGMTDNQTPANLMGVVSIGIVFGAAAAGAWISLANVNRALIGGLLLGPIIIAQALTHSFNLVLVLQISLGFCGGLFVVPLNALLQARGHESVGAGHALATQNFAENLAMLLFVGAYSAATAAGVPVTWSMAGFGGLILMVLAGLAVGRR